MYICMCVVLMNLDAFKNVLLEKELVKRTMENGKCLCEHFVYYVYYVACTMYIINIINII